MGDCVFNPGGLSNPAIKFGMITEDSIARLTQSMENSEHVKRRRGVVTRQQKTRQEKDVKARDKAVKKTDDQEKRAALATTKCFKSTAKARLVKPKTKQVGQSKKAPCDKHTPLEAFDNLHDAVQSTPIIASEG